MDWTIVEPIKCGCGTEIKPHISANVVICSCGRKHIADLLTVHIHSFKLKEEEK